MNLKQMLDNCVVALGALMVVLLLGVIAGLAILGVHAVLMIGAPCG